MYICHCPLRNLIWNTILVFGIWCKTNIPFAYFRFVYKLYVFWRFSLRDYYMTISISTLVLARDFHIKPDSEAEGLIWVEGWYQVRYGKFHVIIFLSHILHWPFPSIDFYIAKQIFELTNCENKSLENIFNFHMNTGITLMYGHTLYKTTNCLKFYASHFFFIFFTINVKERRKGKQKWTIQINWHHKAHKTEKTKAKTQRKMCWTPLYANKHK